MVFQGLQSSPGHAWPCLVVPCLVWLGLAWFGWLGLAWLGSAWLAWLGLAWLGSAWNEQLVLLTPNGAVGLCWRQATAGPTTLCSRRPYVCHPCMWQLLSSSHPPIASRKRRQLLCLVAIARCLGMLMTLLVAQLPFACTYIHLAGRHIPDTPR